MELRKIGDNADFWAGVMFLLFGLLAIYLSKDYPMGSAMRMGPGYFPMYLGILMSILGVIIGIKGFVKPEESIGRWAFRPLVMLSIAIIAFGILMERVGFVLSLVVLIVLSTLAGREFRWLEVTLFTIALIIGAVAVFIHGIGLPYQLFWWN